MKYSIVDSKQLVNQKLVEFQDTTNKLNIEVREDSVKRHLNKMLQLEEYIKYTKKTVRLNSLNKRLSLEQSKVGSIIYNSHRFDTFERLSDIITPKINEALEKQLNNFASVSSLNLGNRPTFQ